VLGILSCKIGYYGDYRLVRRSGLFDDSFYLLRYSDVRRSDMDPLAHYLKSGWQEGRNPSDKFDVEFYLEHNPDVTAARLNPLLHYLRHGKDEGRVPSSTICPKLETRESLVVRAMALLKAIGRLMRTDPRRAMKFLQEARLYGFNRAIEKVRARLETISANQDFMSLPDVLEIFHLEPTVPTLFTKKPIDIIIPVYNGMQYLPDLLSGIIRNTSLPYRLIIVDDCSTDENVSNYLRSFIDSHKGQNIELLRNLTNVGFVRTVNRATEYIANHFVILNTDTEVPPQWLERLMYPIFCIENVASNTPLTNAGTLCSFPNIFEDNPILDSLDVQSLDRFFQYVNVDKIIVEAPTGVGFCMAINKAVFDRIGMFDEAFDKGYGEENDWCQRAYALGYKNVISPNLFVYHKHGGSFSKKERERLIDTNKKLLMARHPEYFQQVACFAEKDELKYVRQFLTAMVLSRVGSVCIISHALGGGAGEYANKVKDGLLENGIPIVEFIYDAYTGNYLITFSEPRCSFSLRIDDLKLLSKVVRLLNIKRVIVNELVTFPNPQEILDLFTNFSEHGDIKLEFCLHDYFAVCPMYNLLDYRMNYCGIPEDLSQCDFCLRQNPLLDKYVGGLTYVLKSGSMASWRNGWGSFLSKCDLITVFSPSSKALLLKAYPAIENRIEVTPHVVDWVRPVRTRGKTEGPINVAVLGRLAFHKGRDIILGMARYVEQEDNGICIHLFGELILDYKEDLSNRHLIQHGKYDKQELPRLFEENGIDIVLIPSICPETFSFVTEEAIQMGLPVMVFDLGAPAERVRCYSKGIVIDRIDCRQVIAAIIRYFQRSDSKSCDRIGSCEGKRLICVTNNYYIFQTNLGNNPYVRDLDMQIFNNVQENVPITVRYNSAIRQAAEEGFTGWLIFVHHDFAFLQDIISILDGLDKEAIYGTIGARLRKGRKELIGEINQGHDGGFIKHGMKIIDPEVVDTIDCQCIMCHSSLLFQHELYFDETGPVDFHQYAEEFCLRAMKEHSIVTKVVQLECRHSSWGKLEDSFEQSMRYLRSLYGDSWAGTCTHLSQG
jgi:GT2 family glycosyltransferase/glycosyltransferase involved in cell wall biosynthesis